ncbi:hypothetical protein JTE90_010981, partial [Oedothorax gibbosus]
MSLADELLADLEEAGETEDALLQLDAPLQEVEDVPMETVEDAFRTIRAIAKLRDSEQLKRVMEEIARRRHQERKE